MIPAGAIVAVLVLAMGALAALAEWLHVRREERQTRWMREAFHAPTVENPNPKNTEKRS